MLELPPVTECQGCGAWNERHRALCVLCGTPLAETDEWDAAAELPPLPPLPDGGLSVTMPEWLRAVPDAPGPGSPEPAALLPAAAARASSTPLTSASISLGEEADVVVMPGPHQPVSEHAPPTEPPLGTRADPRTFLRDEDFPRWIRELPALPPRPAPPVTVIAPPATDLTALAAPSGNPVLPPAPLPDPPAGAPEDPPRNPDKVAEAAEPPHAPPSSPAVQAVSTNSATRRREPWETPLLVMLVVGVVAAVIWALLVNGLIGSGL